MNFFYKTRIIDYSLLLGVIHLEGRSEEDLKKINQLELEGKLFKSTSE